MGFSQEDGLPGGGGGFDRPAVLELRSGDHHHVHVLALDASSVVGVDRGIPRLGGGADGFLVEIGRGYQFDPVAEMGHCRQMRRPGNGAASYQRHPYRLHRCASMHRRSLFFLEQIRRVPPGT